MRIDGRTHVWKDICDAWCLLLCTHANLQKDIKNIGMVKLTEYEWTSQAIEGHFILGLESILVKGSSPNQKDRGAWEGDEETKMEVAWLVRQREMVPSPRPAKIYEWWNASRGSTTSSVFAGYILKIGGSIKHLH